MVHNGTTVRKRANNLRIVINNWILSTYTFVTKSYNDYAIIININGTIPTKEGNKFIIQKSREID